MNGADRENESGKRIRFPAPDGLKFKNEGRDRGRDMQMERERVLENH